MASSPSPFHSFNAAGAKAFLRQHQRKVAAGGGIIVASTVAVTARLRMQAYDTALKHRQAQNGMQVFAGCVRSLERRGLDCSACVSLGTYNAAAPSAAAIKGAGKHQESCLVVVFGNSKVLWDHFVDAYKEDKDVRDSADPLDAFVEKATRASIREALGLTDDEEIPGVRVYWSKDTEDGKLVAIQRMAHEARLAYLDETTHQSIHPKFGPWCAFRGAIVFDDVMGPDAMPAPMTCPVSDEALKDASQAFDVAIKNYTNTSGEDPEQWKLWLAARDAMDGGKFVEHRYGEDQMHWHYQVDRKTIRDRM